LVTCRAFNKGERNLTPDPSPRGEGKKRPHPASPKGRRKSGIIKKVLFRWIVISTFDSTIADTNSGVYGLVCVAIEVKRETFFLATFRAGVPGSFAFVRLEIWFGVHCNEK